jgi:allophanate hydrolase
MSDLSFDLESLHAAYAAGTLPATVINTVFARLEAAADPGIFLHVAERDALLRQAESLGPFDPVAKPLWGVPFAVKDNIDVAGMPTTAACADFAYVPEKDAAVVALLKAAGALVIGKTNLDQFATGLVGIRTPYPVPRNAIDASLVPGGSSSGSAVATARGIVSFALGTDTAGSGRIPAGLNNIVGLKPSVGAFSATGVVPACRTLDCVSVFALTAVDAWKVFSIASRHDPVDSYSRPFPPRALATPPSTLTIGVPAAVDRKFFGDEEMRKGFEAALEALATLPARIVELPFDSFYRVANLLYEGAWVAERYAAIAGFMAEKEESLHPVTRKIIGGARTLSAADAFKGLYALQALKVELAPVIASVDMICVPTAPRHYTVAEVLADPIVTNSRLGTYTNFVNLLDLCGIAVPVGRRGDGLPMSVTMLAPAGHDDRVASVAALLHKASGLTLGATGRPLPVQPLPKGSATNGEIEIVVVGAHMTGMPLNGELKTRGARFCREAQTSADYRLFALAGQSVPKPGLQRMGDGEGAPIDVEVWSLAPDQFAAFVAVIPPPLGIGTIMLADGTSPKGFLAEAAGLSGATDITSFGGWRRYAASLAVKP